LRLSQKSKDSPNKTQVQSVAAGTNSACFDVQADLRSSWYHQEASNQRPHSNIYHLI